MNAREPDTTITIECPSGGGGPGVVSESGASRTTPADEFYGGIWWVWAYDGTGQLRNATPSECAREIMRLRRKLTNIANHTTDPWAKEEATNG